MTQPSHDRWVEVTPSPFAHEAAGLELVRKVLPDETPFRAWSNLTFMDLKGRWHEIDLLVLGRGRLHLIELKHYEGVLRGNEHSWLREGKRPEESPLRLANDKAKFLQSRLNHEVAKSSPGPPENASTPARSSPSSRHRCSCTTTASPAP